MVAQELLHQQRTLAPKDDLTPFAGQWVVLRDGRVIDSAPKMKELIGRGLPGDRDSVLRVSSLDGSLAL
jgi:hypothetical protein